MTRSITGVVPSTPLPEGACVEIRLQRVDRMPEELEAKEIKQCR